MSTKYKILILGASYGSLLGAKLLLAGHTVKLVCLPAEAELINAEGIRVRMPVKGREGLVELDSRTDARQALRGRPAVGQSGRLRPGRARDAGAAVPLARRARAAGRGREGQGAVHVDHEHAAAHLPEAHSRHRRRRVQGGLYRPDRVGQFRSGLHDAVQPRPAGVPSAGRQGQRAAGAPADQLQGGRASSPTRTPPSCASSKPTSKRSASMSAATSSSCR